MKKIANIIPILIVILLYHSAFAEETRPRLITVTGNAEVMVVPDEIVITLGVETCKKDLNSAKTENDKRIQKVINAAEKNGIDRKHIRTDFMNIEPQYDYKYENSRAFIGYIVRQSIVMTLRDTSTFEGVLGDALEAGANFVQDIQFRTTELRKHKDEARILAVKAAREKANDLAGELGQKVGKPYSIEEIPSGNQPWNHLSLQRGGGMIQNITMDEAGSAGSHATIALGQIKISAMVAVSFELE